MPSIKIVCQSETRIKKQLENERTLDEYNTSNPRTEGYIEDDPSVKDWLRQRAPTGEGVLNYISTLFPFSKWILSYNLQWFIGDLIAGVTVGLVVIPQGMAYAKIAQLPVQFGLYTSFMGALVYWIFGTSKDVNIGPVAVTSIVTGTILLEIREQDKLPPTYEPYAIAASLALISGLAICLIGLLRLGWIVDLISLPAVSGFVSGTAITIALGQVSSMLGIRNLKKSDPPYMMFFNTCKRLRETKIDAATGVSALVLLYLIKYSCEMAGKRPTWSKWSKAIFFFSTLRTIVVLFLYTIISYVINKDHKDKPLFKLVGFVPAGFQEAGIPKLDSNLLNVLLPNLPTMLIVLMIEHISIGKSFGRINNYTIDTSQEIVAIGVTNVLGPFLGAFPATGSFSRTAIKSKAGVRTPFGGVVAAGVVLLAIYELTPVIFFVPTSSLAAIIIHAVIDMIAGPKVVVQFWRVAPTDAIIYIVGFLVIIFTSIETGIYTMVGLSLGLLLFRMFKAHGHFLGSVTVYGVPRAVCPKGTEDSSGDVVQRPSFQTDREIEKTVYLPLNRYDGSNPRTNISKPIPGVFVYRFAQDFNYTNASHYIEHLVGYIKTEARQTTVDKSIKPGDRPWNDPAPPRLFRSKTEIEEVDVRPTVKAVIMDLSAVSYVDTTSVQALVDARNVLDHYAAPHSVQWHFANVYNRWTKRALANVGFGLPSRNAEEGQTRQWLSLFSVADIASSSVATGKLKRVDHRHSKDIEKGEWYDAQEYVDPRFSGTLKEIRVADSMPAEDRISFEKSAVTMNEDVDAGSPNAISVSEAQAVVHGINRPFFHADLDIAMRCVLENLEP